MWTALSKYIMGFVVVGLVIATSTCWYLATELEALEAKCLTYELKENMYQSQIVEANLQLEKANRLVDEYKLDLEQFTKTMKQKELELAQARQIEYDLIQEELEKDSSCNKQLEIIDRVLHDFTKN